MEHPTTIVVSDGYQILIIVFIYHIYAVVIACTKSIKKENIFVYFQSIYVRAINVKHINI